MPAPELFSTANAPARRDARYFALLTSVSIAAMLVVTPGAYAKPLGNWSAAPSAAAIAAAQSGAQEAARAARAAGNSLKRATLAIQAQQASQQAARDAARAALSASSVTNGLGVGGLQRAPGAVPGSDLWKGANLPTQFTDGDRTKVNIEQTQQKAVLTWDTFHVGGRTDLNFQQANSNYVALNRVLGTDGRPSQILGSINAKGSVYVINQNGIIFGGASQVNVGALIASTAKMSNEQFAKGIYSTGSGSTWTPSFTDAAELLGLREGGGKVEVKAGAQITTHAPAGVTEGGGFVLLMGGEVHNAGAITTPLGQTQLAAGDNFVLRPGYDPEKSKFSTTRGNEIAPLFNSGSVAGLVRNEGMIFSPQGDITLAGRTIEQNGVLVASTSVNTRGTIHLLNSATDTLGSITLGANSLTTIIPELESGETALNSQRDGLIAASDAANLLRAQADFGTTFNNLSKLADRLDQSRIEIVTGGDVVFKGATGVGSLTIAQGGQVSVSAGKRIFTESGSIIDVSGVRDVSLAMSSNNVLVNIQGNELRDSPVNRDQNYLKNADVWVDIRDLTYVPAGTGGYDVDRYYTPGGLLEVGGYLANAKHSIGEWSSVGGTITLSAPEVVARAGSAFDISGGSIRYDAGYILTSNFLGKDGRITNINNARGDMLFYGLGQGFIRKSERWGITEIWTSIFGRGRVSRRWEDGYTVGRDAGALILSTPTSIFEADILADIVQGQRQINARPAGVTDGYKLTQTAAPLQGALAIGQYGALGLVGAYNSDVRIGDYATPSQIANTIQLDISRLNAQHLGGIDIATRGNIAIEGKTLSDGSKIGLTLADGGNVNLVASVVDIKADITARSGAVKASGILKTHYLSSGNVTLNIDRMGNGAILRSGVTIDTRGIWTNATLDPASLRSRTYVNGGNVVLDSSPIVENGALIDASAGGVLTFGGLSFGKGGDIALGDIGPGAIANQGNVGVATLLGTVRSNGATGGAFYLQSSSILIADAGTNPQGAQLLTPDFFQQGFSSYTINGYRGLTIAADTKVVVEQPVYQARTDIFSLPTGGDIAGLVDLNLHDQFYWENPAKAVLTQRAGADLTLLSGPNAGIQGGGSSTSGSVTMARDASISVDPGRKVTIASGGQITIDGRITAPGGEIAILNNLSAPQGAQPGLVSIWIGDHAYLDASARPFTASDMKGRLYGVVPDGGKVILGSGGGKDSQTTNAVISSVAYVIVRDGAKIDVSGASAELDLFSYGSGLGATTTRRTVASSGGSIVMDSYSGIYNDGTLLARAGGAGASGGSLTLNLESIMLSTFNVPVGMRPGRILHISQDTHRTPLPANLQPGTAHSNLVPGYANLSAQQVSEGGFDSLSLFARTGIVFEGNVDLSAGRSIALRTSSIYTPGGAANVSAPYVMLDGQFVVQPMLPGQVLASEVPAYKTGTFGVHAGLIDFTNRMGIYADKAVLDSTGDLRFLNLTTTPFSDGAGNETVLMVSGPELDLIAERIFPASNANVNIYAADKLGNATGSSNANAEDRKKWPASTITIGRHGSGPVATPYSLFGQLTLNASTIKQGGNLFAPSGALIFNATPPSTWYTDNYAPEAANRGTVQFLPGSITSVSTRNLAIPFGGTADGVRYTVDGTEVVAYDLTTGRKVNVVSGGKPLGISVTASHVISESGSLLDVSGGGDVQGAAFVSGRGGSVDTLLYPLVASNPANSYSAAGNKVYAIVPGVVTSPVAGGYYNAWTGAVPGIGQQIEIPAGVPGLAAGVYTLLPANYAVLPGAFRIELGAKSTSAIPGAQALGNGSYILSGYQGVANTLIRDVLPTQLIVTPASAVGTYSQYNNTSYDAFQLARMASVGAMRPLLTIDGKTLGLNLYNLATGSPDRTEDALRFDGEAEFLTGPGGFGGKLYISSGDGFGGTVGDLVIKADGSSTKRSANSATISASTIAKFRAPNVQLGASSSSIYGALNLLIEGGVALTGSQITLSGSTSLTLQKGVTVNAIGSGIVPVASQTDPAGSITLRGGNVVVEDDVSLSSDGSILFSATQNVNISPRMRFRTRDLELSLPNINIGSTEALAAQGSLPQGLSFGPDMLAILMRKDSVTGTPGMKNLILSAKQSINFFGSVDISTLDANGVSLLDSLVFSTPAIYGVGGSSDRVSITADRLVWRGYEGAKPNAPAATGPGNGHGSITVNAREVVFGYNKKTTPDVTLTLDRLMLGFSEVSFVASERITSNLKGNLAVYEQAGPAGTYDFKTYAGIKGKLNLIAPLLMGEAGSVMSFRAGDALNVKAPGGAATPAQPGALGAEINLLADTINVESTVWLPSGKLTMTAEKDIHLAATSRLNLAGQAVRFFDVTKYSWGGEILLESKHGNITQDAGAVIDVSATANDAGRVSALALDAAAGRVALGGTLLGQGGDGYLGGVIDIRAQRIGADKNNLSTDFASLNDRLNEGKLFGGRFFQLKQGDLAIGNGLRAHEVDISIDGGSLTVGGRIDASGSKPGSIRLAARDDLTLGASAALDVRGTKLQVDSYNQPIEAMNRGRIELTSAHGSLILTPGARMDLRAPDGIDRGRIELNAPRRGADDIAVSAPGGLTILGAQSVGLNAFRSYTPGDGVIDQAYLDAIHVDSTAFINAARLNNPLLGRIAGLTGLGPRFHLRPGVEITSAGNIETRGDLDLSDYRYGPDANPLVRGSGEAGAFVVRAGGNLAVNGSISDGFAPSPATPAIYAPVADIKTSSAFSDFVRNGITYRRVLKPQTIVVVAPAGWKVPAGLPYLPRDQATQERYNVGETITYGTVLDLLYIDPADAASVANVFGTLVTLAKPSAPATSAAASMLAPGSQSASIRLVSGADTAAASSRVLAAKSVLGNTGNFTLGNTADALSLTPRVIRTGTGDLDLLAGGNFSQNSLYGIYTAGTPTSLGADDAKYAALAGYYFPDHGGDLRIAAQGDLTSWILQDRSGSYLASTGPSSFAVANWLKRQGNYKTGQYTAWAINFGSFAGFGTLGGGNVTVTAGGNAGTLTLPTSGSDLVTRSTGLVIAVGATGRVTDITKDSAGAVTGGKLVQTGGGDITLRVGNRLNPALSDSPYSVNDTYMDDFNGSLTNVRGNITLDASAIGSIPLRYAAVQSEDPRNLDPYEPTMVRKENGVQGGLVLVPGDSQVLLRTRGDLAVGGYGDPGQVNANMQNKKPGGTWFSLWRDTTSVDLFSAGGNLMPVNSPGSQNDLSYDNDKRTFNEWWAANRTQDNTILAMLPGQFRATALGGSIVYSGSATLSWYFDSNTGKTVLGANNTVFETAPSAAGQLELLAQQSVLGGAFGTDSSIGAGDPIARVTVPARLNVSGAKSDPDSIPNPFKPAFNETVPGFYAFQRDTVTSYNNKASDPIRIYAVNGDLLNVLLGEVVTNPDGVTDPYMLYIGAKSVRALAGRDIVNFGRGRLSNTNPGYILHSDPTDISVIHAGRNILYADVRISGPGLLEVSAGGSIYQGEKGSIVSLGPIVAGDTRPGASILMQAGAGKAGPNYTGLLPYLDSANLAIYGTPLIEQPGKVAKTYEKELATWLKERFGFAASSDEDARAYFAVLASEQQAIFLRTIYFAELKESGREYTGKIESTRLASYIRGQKAIEALFPETGRDGKPSTYAGDITMFSTEKYTTTTLGGRTTIARSTQDGSVRTQAGGDIQFLTPGGQIVVGVEGVVPGANAGVMTQFGGGIQVYSHGSILLGLSRIMTNYGDDIFAWSDYGDINAGRGAKTTIGYTPPRRAYDADGNVSLIPSVPQAGAGISARSGIPGVAAGDIDLHARRGTIDVGEAGIAGRNINISALHIVNAANISAQGNVTGVPTVQAPNVAGLTEASNVAGSAAQQMAKPTQTEAGERPSIIIVEVLGFGGGDGGEPATEPKPRRERQSSNYDPNASVEVLGNGPDLAERARGLSDDERRQIGSRLGTP